MKHGLIAAAVLGVTGIIGFVWLKPDSRNTGQAAPNPVLVTGPGESVALEADAGRVFRRAFWRHPGKEDIIHHAERREWSETSSQDLRRWQWFLQVSPGPELLEALRDEAKFGLTRTAAPRSWSSLAPPPHWFSPADSVDGYQVYQSPRGGMTLFHLPEKNLLFAADEGYGMTSPVINE